MYMYFLCLFMPIDFKIILFKAFNMFILKKCSCPFTENFNLAFMLVNA